VCAPERIDFARFDDLHHVMTAAEATITILSDRTKINRCIATGGT
jgi:hypothetical protein